MLNNGSKLSSVTYFSHSAADTVELGIQLGQQFPAGSIVCLFGDLGAGKTTLIKGIVEGVCERKDLLVTSPTFVYLNIYKGSRTVYHFDLYRLHDVDEFLSMGFEEYFFGGGVVCIEWSERIQSLLPPNCIKIELKHIILNSREIKVTVP